MGMFDSIHFEGKEYQTKDTPEQALDTYEIRGDELWWRKTEHDWVEDEDAMFGGYLQETSHEWIFCENFDGLIRFYREDEDNGGYEKNAWIEYKALFMNGKIIKFEQKQ